MISLDMKYTSLYWALRFIENELDIYSKQYSKCRLSIHAENQYVNYDNIQIESDACSALTRHKDFVILECVDRLLKKNVYPRNIIINRSAGKADIIVSDEIAVRCESWGEDFDSAKEEIFPTNCKYTVLYTSRLVSGLLEYKSIIIFNGDKYNYGIFEDNADISQIILIKAVNPEIEQTTDIKEFEIFEDELIVYNGKSKIVHVPKGITTIGSSAFWNNTSVEEVILPLSIKRIGGDAFYYCTSLKKINIPKRVFIMGNNPFAGCPLLKITNESPCFVLDNDVLYNKDKTNLIHYTILKENKEFVIPNETICLGKHCFFACNNLEKIIVPSSVIRLENNPFSGCEKLVVENYSPHYIFKDGVIYNRFMTTIVGVLNGTDLEEYIVPETVTLISRNSFWNCKRIKKIVITRNVTRIGYNPFAGCENLIIESENPQYIVKNGILLNSDASEIICCTNLAGLGELELDKSIKTIGRSAFSGCIDLIDINFNSVETIGKSSFTNCTSLKRLYIPDTVKYIGPWAFSYCTNLKEISISCNTIIERDAFNECPVNIIRR